MHDDTDTDDRRATERASTDRTRTPTDRTDPTTGFNASTRRDVLRVVGGGAVVGAIGTGSVGAAPDAMEFVETDGTEFVIDGEPVYFGGSNNFWITDAYEDRQRVDDVFALFDEMGLNLVRTFTACEGNDDADAHCMQPEIGVHDEGALEHLDYVVAKAREHGIRLVLTFADYWAHTGGMDEYVRASSTARPESAFDRDTWEGEQAFREQFYTDEECREYYRHHVETILTRENSITGVEYRDEPAIAMWELANEPRAGQVGHEAIHEWFREMATFVKSLDDNHLLTTGMEGFYTAGREDGAGPDWAYDGTEGTDYVEDHRIDEIDVCSFHLYPDHWEFPHENGTGWIREHIADARERVGKPAYCGEFNVNAQENDLETRNEHLRQWYDALDEYDAEAATIWQVVLEDTEDHDGFQVYRSESGDIVEGYSEAVRAKSGSDGGPIADAVGPSTLRIGESGTFDAAYSVVPSGSIAEYEWAFDDGATAAGERVTRRFDEPGTYDVEMTVTDGRGNAATDAETVAVEDIPDDSVLVEGGGETIEGDTKEFHYAYAPQSGDFAVEAYVADVTSTDPGAQAGIMVADDPDSPGALGAITITPGEGAELTRAYDDTVWRERAREGRTPPIWLRLERSDGEVTGYASEDGDEWTAINAGDTDLPDDAVLGLFVSSNSPGERCAAQFDAVTWLDDWQHTDVGDVDVTGHAIAGSGESGGDDDTVPPTAPSNPSVTETTSSTVTVEWDAASDEGGSGLEEYVVSVDDARERTVPAGTTDATIDGLTPDATYEIGVRAIDGAGNESDAATVTATTGPDDESGDGDDGPSDDLNAELVPSTTEAAVGERITFRVDDATDDDAWIDGLEWAFGDGTTASGWWNAHTYDEAGTYTVALTATDNEGTTTTHEVTIEVS